MSDSSSEQIFINYRKVDTAHIAKELAQSLQNVYSNVFLDDKDLRAGEHWPPNLRAAVERCTVFLILIGDGWLQPRLFKWLLSRVFRWLPPHIFAWLRPRLPERLQPRIFVEGDHLRHEIELALRSKPAPLLIPVFCGQFQPAREHLPETIRGLSNLHGVTIRQGAVREGAERLIAEIRGRRPQEPEPKKRSSKFRGEGWSGTSESVFENIEERLVPEKDEPVEGLIENNQILCEKYSGESTIYPGLGYVEVANWCGVLSAGDKPHVEVEYDDTPFVLSQWRDQELTQCGLEALEAYKKKRVKCFNGDAVRISHIGVSPATLKLKVQKATYFDQIQSNRTIDWEVQLRGVTTSRRAELLAGEYGKLPKIEDGRLANTLGVAALIFIKTGDKLVPYLKHRSKEVSFMRDGIHCTASAVAKLGDVAHHATFYEDSMYKALRDEVGLQREDISELAPVALCRELVRCGKPQLFFLGVTSLSQDEVETKFRNLEKNREAPRGVGEPIIHNQNKEIFIRWAHNRSIEEIVKEFPKFKLTMEAAALLLYFLRTQSGTSNEKLFG